MRVPSLIASYYVLLGCYDKDTASTLKGNRIAVDLGKEKVVGEMVGAEGG